MLLIVLLLCVLLFWFGFNYLVWLCLGLLLCVKFCVCIVYRFDIASLHLSCLVWLFGCFILLCDYALLGFSVGDGFGLWDGVI